MANYEHVVVGIFDERTAVRQALNALQQAHFQDDQIGFMVRDERGTPPVEADTRGGPHPVLRGVVGGLIGVVDALLVPFTGPADANAILATTLPVAEEAIDHLPYPGADKDASRVQRPDAPMIAETPVTHAAPTPDPVPTGREQDIAERDLQKQEHASTLTGGVVGGTIGAVVGILVPGIGPAIAAGLLATAFGAAFGGAAGNFMGTFVHLGVPEDRARTYEHALKSGNTIVTVRAGAQTHEAEEILRASGARHVETH